MVTKSKKTETIVKIENQPALRRQGPGGVIPTAGSAGSGPEKFGHRRKVDCAKKRFRWFLCDYYGRVINLNQPPVEHNRRFLKAMTPSRSRRLCS